MDRRASTSLITETDDQLLTARQAAALLGVNTTTVRRWIGDGKLPAYRVGAKAVRIRRADLAGLLSPMHDDHEYHGGSAGSDQASISLLTEKEQQQARRAIADVQRLRAEILARRDGSRFPDSVETIRHAREERFRELTRPRGE